MNYVCCNDTSRRNAVKLHPTLNGIDFLEVLDIPTDPYNKRQRTLYVHFLKADALATLDTTNIRIVGGERIEDIEVLKVEIEADGVYRIKNRSIAMRHRLHDLHPVPDRRRPRAFRTSTPAGSAV